MKRPFSWTLTSGLEARSGRLEFFLSFSWGLNFATCKLIKFSSSLLRQEGKKTVNCPFVYCPLVRLIQPWLTLLHVHFVVAIKRERLIKIFTQNRTTPSWLMNYNQRTEDRALEKVLDFGPQFRLDDATTKTIISGLYYNRIKIVATLVILIS